MRSDTEVNKELVTILRRNYQLQGEVSLTPLREGPDNTVYLVSAAHKRYVLRRSRRPIGSDVAYEIEALSALKKASAPVVSPVAAVNGEFFVCDDERYPLVLFPFVDGEPQRFGAECAIPTACVRSGGEALGMVHQAASQITLRSPRSRTVYTELDRIAQTDAVSTRWSDGKGFLELVTQYRTFGETSGNLLPVIHNDYRPGNVLFLGDRAVSVLDFDWACPGPAEKDLGLALAEWSYYDGGPGIDQAAVAAFLKGYNSRAPIPFTLDSRLLRWVCFACLSDTATYLADCAAEQPKLDSPAKPVASYMYRKFKAFEALIG